MTTLGTLNDFDSLVERGHGLGLKMLIDLVLSHTAEIWADARSDGTPPSKWLSVFGGSSRERDVERMQYYSRNFLPEQPNLNFHNPEVQDAVLDVLRLSLNRGLDGFCLDVVNSCFHDPRLRKNPPLDSDLRKAMTAPAVNPYNFQDYLFDKTQPEILAFLERLRALPDTYPAKMTGGEVGEAQRGTALQAAYTAGDRRLHICYGFEKLTGAFPSGSRIGAILVDFERGGRDSWSCWAFSNDDVPRHPSRSGLSEAELRLCRAILCSLRVSICLYQGEDGLRFSPKFEGRDGCCTPRPWTAEAHHAGFSEIDPCLPMATEHLDHAVSAQERDPGSTLNFSRALLDFGRAHAPLIKGGVTPFRADDDALTLLGELDGLRMVCAFNLTGEDRKVPLPGVIGGSTSMPCSRTP